MKVVFLQDDFPPESFGGAGISTFEIALQMKKCGHEVSVITTCRKKDDVGEGEYEGLKVFKIHSNYHERWRAYKSLYNRKVVKGLEKKLEEIKPDLVHVNNVHFHLSYHSIKVAKKYASVVIFTARDVMSFNYGGLKTRRFLEHFDYKTTWIDHLRQAGKRWNPLRNIIIKNYLKYADKILAVSDALKEALNKNGINNVEVLRTGIDVSRWTLDEEKIIKFRKKYNLENKKIVFFGGRLSEAKGGGKIIQTIARVSEKVPNTVLLVAGKTDSYVDKMKHSGDKLSLQDRIVFTGWISGDELKAAYHASDVVCVPTLYFDSLPRTVIEGMAVGKPVIGTCFGGAKEAIEDSVTGHVINPFNVQDLAERIEEILLDEEKAKRLGEAGLERVKTKFNIDDKVNQAISLYKELSAQKNR